MRALAPVTNLFKHKQHESEEKITLVEPISDIIQESECSSPKATTSIPIPAKIIIHRVESGEKPFWMDSDKSEISAPAQQTQQSNLIPELVITEDTSPKLPRLQHESSGEIPWWLDESAEIPEGIETYPNWVREDGTTADGRVIYKMRKYDSDDTSWWLSSTDKTNTESGNKPTNVMDEEYLEKHKIRHIDSGERAWWLNSSENVSEMVSLALVKF